MSFINANPHTPITNTINIPCANICNPAAPASRDGEAAAPIRVTIRPVEPAPSCPHALLARIVECLPLNAPAGPIPEAPKITRENDGAGLSIFATGQILVPLAKREYSREERRLFELFGVELQEFSAGRRGCVWSAPVGLLAKALEAVKAYQQGSGADPSTITHGLGVTGLRVPHAQRAIDDDLAALYETLSLETIDLVFDVGESGKVSEVVTTVLDHVERVRNRGALSVQDKKWHTLPLTSIGLRAYYAAPMAPILRTLASFCGVPYCSMLNSEGVFWVAALDGPSMLASAKALGILH